MLPNFIGVGPQRTATTWLREALSPHVGFPKGVNETMFFDLHYNKGLQWYQSHFRGYPASIVLGEIAPTYFHSTEARCRIVRNLPECKIICTFRDPVKRLYSMYRLLREYGWTTLPFERAISEVPLMMESSAYTKHFGEWRQVFGAGRVLALINYDLYRSPDEYVKTVCDFIEIPRFSLSEEQKQPTAKEYPARFPYLARVGQSIGDLLRSRRLYSIINLAKKLGLKTVFFGGGNDLPPMDPELEKHLRSLFTSEVDNLELMLGRDLSTWK
jgi:hypothetical protein